jgi:hypothetical protein
MENYIFFPFLIIYSHSMEGKQKFRPDPQLRLMDQVRQVLRYHHYAYRTEKTYCDWIVRYIKFHGSRKHGRDMSAEGDAVK